MTFSKTVLAVDDEPMILEALAAYLESRGYRVLTASNGRDAIAQASRLWSVSAAEGGIDIILLDLMLPDISGEEVCRIIRSNSDVPIIMLTAKVEESSQLEGLELGADDYVTKPFSLKLLAARIEAVLRRAPDNADLFADAQLTATERKIVNTLSRRPNRIFTRDELISQAFDEEFDGFDRVIDTHIKNLRRKIGSEYIKTVHGIGYKWGEPQ